MSTKSHSHNHVFFLSNPEIGNLVPTVQFAQRLLNHRPGLFSATVFIIPLPQRPLVNTFVQSLPNAVPNIRFLHLPPVDLPSPDQLPSSEIGHISLLVEKQKPHVKRAIEDLHSAESDSNSGRVAALFVDMFCTSMIDLAGDLGVPCYLFYASPATFLGFMLELQVLDPQLSSDSVTHELRLPSFANPLPWNVLPTTVLKRRDGYSWYLYHARRYTETKGIVINTFRELEPYALDSLRKSGVPKVFPIGPVIDINGPAQWHPERAQYERVLKWLDNQPASSVVFLCFGSMRSLTGPQVREIAVGLERAGYRFLWTLREPPKSKLGIPSDYVNFDEVLPRGFLERTSGMGLVCGWAPQVTILAHQAVGGFVSHCGWNSILESLWHGVPIATWPIFAEQQMNAFEMVEELGLGVKIRLDYREGSNLVLAEEVEKGVKDLMEVDNEVREKVKRMRETSRMTLMENGSSQESFRALVEELTATRN
ncbi:UDP-glucuronosyl/UDP-glucosyltransferase [Trema orientale]|uniref:Glycosyltransferase n=1 Tax=Trema orientale TaxID=63057 RepID=A0A2P5BZ25_TREOI|nr:UDP-glucuronosyl/UDP-glucosyltransferase [Trema orientale]